MDFEKSILTVSMEDPTILWNATENAGHDREIVLVFRKYINILLRTDRTIYNGGRSQTRGQRITANFLTGHTLDHERMHKGIESQNKDRAATQDYRSSNDRGGLDI